MRAIKLSEPIVFPDSPSGVSGRRCHAGEAWLDPRKLADFNQRIGRCVSSAANVDADSLSSLARKLLKQRMARRDRPESVSERLRCAALMDMMLQDRGWTPKKQAERIAAEVVEYVRSESGDQKLIPNEEAVVGRLDDAVLVDSVWPVVKHEVLAYCDYRRLRLIEAELRGNRPQRIEFTRKHYEQAREAEAQLYRSQRRIGLDPYVETTSPPRDDGMVLY